MRSIVRENKTLIAILLGGIVLRVWHIGWGLPDIYEEATPLSISLKFWDQLGSFNPHFFNYPALTFYINFLGQALVYPLGHLFGFFPDFRTFETDPTALAVTARLVSVAFDAGTIIALALLARRVAGERAGLIAAALAAVNPFQIQQAHMIQVDTVLTFFTVVALVFIEKLYREPRVKWYVLAAVAIGLAASSKYTGALLLPALVVVRLLRERSWRGALQALQDPLLYLAVLVAGGVFLAMNPYILLNYSEFKEGFGFEQQHIAYGHLGVDPNESTLAYYLLDALPSMLGWGALLVIGGTIVVFLVKKERARYRILVFPLIYLAVLSTWEMRAERYILPALPVLILIGSIGILEAWDFLSGYIKAPGTISRVVSGLLLGCVVLIEPVGSTMKYLGPLGLPDTRALTRDWIAKRLPVGSVIASGPYGVEFPETQYFTFHIPFLGFESERVAPFYDARWYEDVDLLITSDYDYARYAREPKRYAEFLDYYDSLRARWKLELEIGPSAERTGPSFWIYSFSDSLRSARFDTTLFMRLAAEPESARISNFLKDLNIVLIKKGKLEKSEQVLKEILSVEVENFPMRNLLAQVMVNLGRYEPALTQLLTSLKQKPDQPEAFALAGHALLMLKHYREAEPTLQKAISLNGSLPSPYEDLIMLYTDNQSWKELALVLRHYSKILPAGSPRQKEVEQQLLKLEGG